MSHVLCGTWAPAILRIVPDMDSESSFSARTNMKNYDSSTPRTCTCYQRLAKQLIYPAPSFEPRVLPCFRQTATQGGAQGAEMTKTKHDPEHAGDAAGTIRGADSNSINPNMV